MKTYSDIIIDLENELVVQPYYLANLAFEIVQQESQISEEQNVILQAFFLKKIHSTQQSNLLEKRIDYAIRIMQDKIILYEELVKLYSLFQEIYALKRLGLKPQQDLSEFYKTLADVYKKYAKNLTEIERKFQIECIEVNFRSNFLD